FPASNYSGHVGLTAAFSPSGTLAYVYSDLTGVSNAPSGFSPALGPIDIQTFDPNLKPLRLVNLGNVSNVRVSVNDDGSFEAFWTAVDARGSTSTLMSRSERFAADGTQGEVHTIDFATQTQTVVQGPTGPFVYQYSGHLGLTAAFSPNGTLAYVYSD